MRIVSLVLIFTALVLAGCTGPTRDTARTSSPSIPHSFTYLEDHPQGNMTFLVEVSDLPEGAACGVHETHVGWSTPPVTWKFYKVGQDPLESGFEGGGLYRERNTQAHATPLGLDSRTPWDYGEPVSHHSDLLLRDSALYVFAWGGVLDAPFNLTVSCTAPARPVLEGVGHELDLVTHGRMAGGVGVSEANPVTAEADAAASVGDHFERNYVSTNLYVEVFGGLGSHEGKLELSGAINDTYLMSGLLYETPSGSGGTLRADLSSAADQASFTMFVIGVDPLA